jgi:hypothetical protein
MAITALDATVLIAICSPSRPDLADHRGRGGSVAHITFNARTLCSVLAG